MKPATVERRAFSPAEIAARNNFGEATVWRQIRAGRLVAQKLGRRTFVTLENEKAWLDSMPRIVTASTDARAA
ncbi:hypothetical protein [Tahibacter harae]|uniref:Excisionase family DNA binding protein n=1 Tax=Tahibacter harae TaxID=2963937 RepID=A0ABT1QQZ5_9GAMM|nr:hypothetical protein [Tahibacter harae]MCQ4164696.1 hypothetical protein [Tahibacter harae]